MVPNKKKNYIWYHSALMCEHSTATHDKKKIYIFGSSETFISQILIKEICIYPHDLSLSHVN